MTSNPNKSPFDDVPYTVASVLLYAAIHDRVNDAATGKLPLSENVNGALRKKFASLNPQAVDTLVNNAGEVYKIIRSPDRIFANGSIDKLLPLANSNHIPASILYEPVSIERFYKALDTLKATEQRPGDIQQIKDAVESYYNKERLVVALGRTNSIG